MKYTEILKKNRLIGNELKSKLYKVTILSNIVVNQSKEILEYFLRDSDINAIIEFGNYDNIVQDSSHYKNSDAVIIFWEICNIFDGFQSVVESLDPTDLDEIAEKKKSEIDFVLGNLGETSLVLMNKFSALHFDSLNLEESNLQKLSIQLNKHLGKEIKANTKLVDLEKIIANVGINDSIDLRYFHLSKALYTVEFFQEYAKHILPYFSASNGKAKKAIIFDCDNTLWKGILGEDGFKNIEMSSKTKDGSVFAEVQALAKTLSNRGVLIGLCTKNNSEDIQEVISSHPDMQLKEKFITIIKSNWSDKVSNLKQIANELNISLDSLVFVDDSDFEVNLVRHHIPEVITFQVPKKLYNYPKMIRNMFGLFFNLSSSIEDKHKRLMYKQQEKRFAAKEKFTKIEDYLESLELKITIFCNEKSVIPRLSQMCQKTNQFNLTTKRYTEGDIEKYMNDNESKIYGFSVQDKYGDSGITGLCIILPTEKKEMVVIDTFLMSCRVIGRNIEYAFMDFIINEMKTLNKTLINARYIETPKNRQVETFYDNLNFCLTKQDRTDKYYLLKIDEYIPQKIRYVEIKSE